MNETHKTMTLWHLIASRLLLHLTLAAICVCAVNVLLDHHWPPVYFQMEHSIPHPQELIIDPDLKQYQHLTAEQLQQLNASLQVLDETLTVTESINAAIQPGYQYTVEELLALLLDRQRKHSDHLLYSEHFVNEAGQTVTVILEQHLDRNLFELFQQNARFYAFLKLFLSGLLLLLFMILFIRSIYKPLQKNLDIINSSIAKTPHDATPVDVSQVSLRETRLLLNTYNTMLEKMAQSKREKDALEAQSHRLIANLSHDLKSPMTTIKGYAELLEQEELTAEAQQLYIDRIHSNVSALNSMVELLSEQVKYQYNDYPLHLENKDMNDFLREICANYYTIFEKQGFLMEVQIEETPCYLTFDALCMRRVYANLLENILSHNTAPTQVQICTRILPDCYQIKVKDNGTGIAPSEQDKIFEPFYQGDPARTKQHSGLGLFAAKQLLEKHGASLRLEREPAYKTVFVIEFPLS